jgi:hypothetical protein
LYFSATSGGGGGATIVQFRENFFCFCVCIVLMSEFNLSFMSYDLINYTGCVIHW